VHIIISMHILVCQELPGYIRFYKELNGVASRHENHLYMCQICATAMLSMIVTNSIELLRSHEIPMYPNVLLENFLYILIDLGPSDAIIKTRMA